MINNLEQQAFRHSIYTQRFAGHLANLFEVYSRKLAKELKLLLIEAPETTNNLKLVNKLINKYRGIALNIYGEYNDKDLLDQLEAFAIAESNWQAKSIQTAVNFSPIVTPASAKLWAAVKTTPLIMEGADGVNLLEPFIKNWESKRIDLVGGLIRSGFMTGRTSNQIASDIAGKNGFIDRQNKTSIKAMVRTATNNVSNVARQKTNEANSDIIRAYKIRATLDDRTSSTCRGFDGLVVKLSDDFKPMPPFHIQCRTTTIPIPYARFTIDDGLGTRASKGVKGGQQIPSSENYYDFLRNQGKQGVLGREFVYDVLGIERGKLFLEGGLSVKRFKLLTMDELFNPIPLSILKTKTSLQLSFDKISG